MENGVPRARGPEGQTSMGACEVAGCKKERCRWIFISEKGRYVRKFCMTEGHFPPGALTNQEPEWQT